MYLSLFNVLFYKLEGFRLRLHFSYVIQKLSNDKLTSARTATEHSRRLSLIDHLRQYQNNNIFPRNLKGGAPKPYFFDANHRACAVADLLLFTDNTLLADDIAKWDNNAYVQDMHFPSLLQWAKNNGVNKQDLMLIQPTYYEVTIFGILILVLNCANLIFLLIHGKKHILNTLLGAGMALVLSYLMTAIS